MADSVTIFGEFQVCKNGLYRATAEKRIELRRMRLPQAGVQKETCQGPE